MKFIVLILAICIPTVLTNYSVSPNLRKLLKIGESIKDLNNPQLDQIYNRALDEELIKPNAVRRLHPGHTSEGKVSNPSGKAMANTTPAKDNAEVAKAFTNWAAAQKKRLEAHTMFYNSEFGIYENLRLSAEAMASAWAETDKKTCDKLKLVMGVNNKNIVKEMAIKKILNTLNKKRHEEDKALKAVRQTLNDTVNKVYAKRRLGTISAPVIPDQGLGEMELTDLPDGNGDDEEEQPESGEKCGGKDKEICNAFNKWIDSLLDLVAKEVKFHTS